MADFKLELENMSEEEEEALLRLIRQLTYNDCINLVWDEDTARLVLSATSKLGEALKKRKIKVA